MTVVLVAVAVGTRPTTLTHHLPGSSRHRQTNPGETRTADLQAPGQSL